MGAHHSDPTPACQRDFAGKSPELVDLILDLAFEVIQRSTPPSKGTKRTASRFSETSLPSIFR
jgi:hypothetical protein